ncbi:MAG: sodium:alanine symporter family protein [Muribaculaceae bacterium]|nr:sodium:alanine symporter family protein [Muribaculaceae bacterium]
MNLEQLTETISSYIWSWPMIILLLGTHIFLTIRLRVPQRKIFTAIKLSFSKDKDSTGDVSQFSALATSLAATIGTGNIIGVATAVSLGGPGAVLWCWLTGVFGIATKYGEGLLAVKYRVKTSDGTMLGGPMYALERGLKMKWLAILFCIFTAIAAFGIGNGVQANAISENFAMLFNGNSGVESISSWLNNALGLSFKPKFYLSFLVGICLMVLVGVVIIGGVKSIGRICSALVPFMAILYVMGCLYILSVNHQYLWDAIRWICRDAFSLKASVGGAAGTAIMMGARYGIARGLFSNESGLGSAPIVAAAARTRNSVRQALVSSTGTFWDTVVVCAITGLVLVTSILAYPEIDFHDGGLLTKKAFGMIPYVGTPILTFGILTFAFSTILGWSYYGERAMEYLGGKKIIKLYRILWLIVCFMGCVMSLSVVWNIADIMNALMALPNLAALLLLSGVIAHETKRYLWSGKLDEIDRTL